jgi:hypothetical protein
VQPTWPATWKNILAGWSKVRTKLETQAEKGFAGLCLLHQRGNSGPAIEG